MILLDRDPIIPKKVLNQNKTELAVLTEPSFLSPQLMETPFMENNDTKSAQEKYFDLLQEICQNELSSEFGKIQENSRSDIMFIQNLIYETPLFALNLQNSLVAAGLKVGARLKLSPPNALFKSDDAVPLLHVAPSSRNFTLTASSSQNMSHINSASHAMEQSCYAPYTILSSSSRNLPPVFEYFDN